MNIWNSWVNPVSVIQIWCGKENQKEKTHFECVKHVRFFFSNRTFYKHKNNCNSANAFPLKMKVVKFGTQSSHTDTDFQENILNRFRDSEVGNLMRENQKIQAVGFRHYCTRRPEKSKIVEIRREVMAEMRELGRLYLCFQSLTSSEVTFEDMFTRSI